MLDRSWSGNAERLSPEAPVPVVRLEHVDESLGGAGNVVRNLMSLGCSVACCGIVGLDEAGDRVTALLDDIDVVDLTVGVPGRRTTVKNRLFADRIQLARFDVEDVGALAGRTLAVLRDNIATWLATTRDCARAIVLSDYDKGVLRGLRLKDSLPAPCVVDPKGTRWGDRYPAGSVLKPNLSEAAVQCGADKADVVADPRRFAAAIHDDTAASAICMTLGPRGLGVLDDHGWTEIVSHEVPVFDVTGAGDTVAAVLAASLGAGLDLRGAARLANIAGAISVSRPRTATVTARDIAAAVKDWAVWGSQIR